MLEGMFKYLAFGSLSGLDVYRVFLFTISFGCFTCLMGELFKNKKKIFYLVILLLIGAYGFTQLEFKYFMGNYTSIKAGADGLERIKDYIIQFIMFAKPIFWVMFLPGIVQLIYIFKIKEQREVDWIRKGILGLLAIICFSLGRYTLYLDEGMVSLVNLYDNPNMLEKSLKEFGLVKFLERDICSIGIEQKDELVVIDFEEVEQVVPEVEEEEIIDYTRVIDDDQWNKWVATESDDNIKAIDEYLLQQKVTDKNEMTGFFEGYNLIYIMVEAFDYIAVDKELTPTLYRMQQSGYHFDNYYTPKYSCTTGESEFIGLTSLVPQSDLCTPNMYCKNAFPEGVFNMFKKAGYYTSAYHNWYDEFYERRILYQSMGCEDYYNLEDMDIEIVQGWQSDDEMIKQALPHFVDNEPFMSLMVTSSTHFPYDSYSVIGERYMDEINEVYPNYPMEIKRYLSKAMELDKAMTTLLDELEEEGILDHTLIVVFADHHPLKTSLSTLIQYTQQLDRSIGKNEDRTPAFMYSSSLESRSLDKVASTFDLLPTILNMFGIDFDPRLYIGRDYFAQGTNVAIFPDGSWVTDEGIYNSSNNSFDGEEVSEEYLKYYNNYVTNAFSVSTRIYRTDYFSKRDF